MEIGFPITIGYGTTETGPMITYSDWTDFVPGSCGTVADNMEIKVLSKDPEHIPGEVVTRGLNVMEGYYKNEKATHAAIDSEGWFHTGDLGDVWRPMVTCSSWGVSRTCFWAPMDRMSTPRR